MGLWYDEECQGRSRFGLKVRATLFSGTSEFQTVDVVDTELFGKTLLIDGLYMTSVVDEPYYHEMIVHPALTCAPRIKRVLVLGGGDGGTVREVLRYPEVERVVMVEIDRMVVEASREHLPEIGSAWDDPRLEVLIDDAVAYVAQAPAGTFDVVIVDGSDPIGPAKTLFSSEFFGNCARVLAEDGVFVTQSESHFTFPETHRQTVLGLREVFGHAWPYYGPVPIYPGGTWSWTFASRSVNPLEPVADRVTAISADTRVYNAEIHRGAFAVPNHLRKELGL